MQQIDVGIRHDALQDELVHPDQRSADGSRHDECRREQRGGATRRAQHRRMRACQAAALDQIDRQPAQRGGGQRGQQQVGGRGHAAGSAEETGGVPQDAAGDEERADDAERDAQKPADVAGAAPRVDQRTGAEQQRDSQQRQRRPLHLAAPPRARGREIPGRHPGIDQCAAAAPRNQKRVGVV